MRIVKNTKYVLICFFVLMCEMLFGKYLEIGGVVPMLSFSLCLATALIEDEPNYIVVQAIVLGAVLDAFSGRGFGTYTITFLLAAFASYFIRDRLFSSKLLLLVCDAFVMTLFLCVIFSLLNIINVGGGFLWMLRDIAVPSAIYNIAVSVVFYALLKKIFGKRR